MNRIQALADGRRMTEEKQSLAKWDLTEIIAGVTAAAFALSVADLLGRYTALGADFSRFLTVQDVLSNAIWIAPIAFLGMAYRLWEALLSSKTPAEVSTTKFVWARRVLLVCVLLGVIVFWTLPPASTLLLVILLMAAYKAAGAILRFKASAGVGSHYASYFNDVFFLFISFLALSYSITIFRMAATDPTHEICLNEGCREASLLDEISSGLVLRWKDDEVLSLVPMSQVHSVSALQPRSMRPIFDIFGVGDTSPKAESPKPEQSNK